MSFDSFQGVVSILDNFPEHALRILEQILILDEILILLVICYTVTLVLCYL